MNENPLPKLDTIEALVSYIETLFDCRDGYHGAYADNMYLSCSKDDDYRYRVVGVITDTKTPDPLRRLRNALAHDFTLLRTTLPTGLPEVKPILYWRFAQEERIQEEQDGLDYASRIDHPHLYKIRTRIAIPGVNWSVLDLPQEGAYYRKI